MQKHLVRVGNSLALVFNKALLSALGVDHRSSLRVACDGERLIVEPVLGDGARRPQSARDALVIARELERLGLSQAVFARLAPVPMQLDGYIIALESHRVRPPEIEVTVRRMATLRERLREGWSGPDAIAAAVAATPFLLPTGVETRLDEGAPRRPLLDVLLEAREAREARDARDAGDAGDAGPGDEARAAVAVDIDRYDADAPHDVEVSIELTPE